MEVRDEGETCLFREVPRLMPRMIVILVRPEMPVIAAAVYWGGFMRLATPRHVAGEEAWNAICSMIGSFRKSGGCVK